MSDFVKKVNAYYEAERKKELRKKIWTILVVCELAFTWLILLIW